MEIIVKQTLVQEIKYKVQGVYDSGKEVDYIEVSVEEYNELVNINLVNESNEIIITTKNSNGNSVPTRIQVIIDYQLLDFEALKKYIQKTYPTFKIQKNIKYETLLAKVDKIVQEVQNAE